MKSIDGVPLCSQDMKGLEGDITIQFPARSIKGKLKRSLFGEKYKFVFNETPEDIKGLVIIEPIYPADKIPKNLRNYQILRLLDGKYTLNTQTSQ